MPVGAFTIEMWISPGEKVENYHGSVLMDKKYIPTGHTDYILSVEGSSDALQTLKIELGFGQKSVRWYSDRVSFEVGKWYHIAFIYDGAGTGEYFVNGQLRGSRREEGIGSVFGFGGNVDVISQTSRGALSMNRSLLRIPRTCSRSSVFRPRGDCLTRCSVRGVSFCRRCR
jgi:hypothetical protein